jgi:protein SCO1/2
VQRTSPHPARLVRRPALGAALGVLAALFFGPPTGRGGEPDPHAGHPGGHAAHEAAARDTGAVSGVQRSLASYPVPAVALVDQRGERVSFPGLLDTDDPLLLNFIFTTCTAICPPMSATFAQVQRELGGDRDRIRMLSISIDPEQDTPERLAEYAKRFRAGPQWIFLTGSLEDSIAVQQAFDAYRGDKMQHAPLTLLRATRGAQGARYEGFASAAELLGALREALED